SSTKPYLPSFAFKKDSKEGVADPKSVFAPWIRAIMIAESRALYLGAGSNCLKEVSCSSSTTINPKFLNGRNNEDLAPTIICAFGLASKTFFQTSVRSFKVYCE